MATCKHCGKNFNDKKDTGVSFWLKSEYCSRRCENIAKRRDKGFHNNLLQKNKTLFAIGIIALVAFMIYETLNDKKDKKTVSMPIQSTPVELVSGGSQTKIVESTIQDTNISKSQTIGVQPEEISAVNFEDIAIEDKQALKLLVQQWSEAHSVSLISDFSILFGDFVQFYGTKLPKKSCIKKKNDLLHKSPDFKQEIHGEIEIVKMADDEFRCNFTKHVTVNQKATDYRSYLVFRKIDNSWEIIVESDLITDGNLRKLK
jgi:hypothetical protein